MTNNHERYCVKSTLKLQHGVKLTEAQLDTIEEIYFESRKTNIANVMFYRIINASIGIIGIVLFFLIRQTWAEKWFFIVFVTLFAIYNIIHSYRILIKYRRLKAPKKVAE